MTGAAMAFLCGIWLRSILPEHVSIEIKGYGTPRIGNAAWADHVDATVSQNSSGRHADLQKGVEAWRIVNYKDVVCRIPPKSMGYRHPRNEIFISKDGAKYHMCREQDCKVCQVLGRHLMIGLLGPIRLWTWMAQGPSSTEKVQGIGAFWAVRRGHAVCGD